jgi:hypothetical protein
MRFLPKERFYPQLFTDVSLQLLFYPCRHSTRLCRKTPTSARERALFLPGKDGEAGDVGFIVDAAGRSQAKKGPLEARSSFLTEPSIRIRAWLGYGKIPGGD